jgi:hypothetical protein
MDLAITHPTDLQSDELIVSFPCDFVSYRLHCLKETFLEEFIRGYYNEIINYLSSDNEVTV